MLKFNVSQDIHTHVQLVVVVLLSAEMFYGWQRNDFDQTCSNKSPSYGHEGDDAGDLWFSCTLKIRPVFPTIGFTDEPS